MNFRMLGLQFNLRGLPAGIARPQGASYSDAIKMNRPAPRSY